MPITINGNGIISGINDVDIVSASATNTPLVVKGASGQSANIIEFQDNSASVLASVSNTGNMVGGGLDFIASQTFSAQSSINFNNCFSSKYENYKILGNYSSTTGPTFQWRFRTSGTDNSTANYQIQRHQSSSTTATNIQQSSQTAGAGWSLAANFPVYSAIEISKPFASDYTVLWYSFARMNSSTQVDVEQGTNAFSLTTSFDGISFFVSSGTFSGSFRVYGYRN